MGGRDFGDVERDGDRGDPDGEARDEPPDEKPIEAASIGEEESPDKKEDQGENESLLSSEVVGDEAAQKGSDEGADEEGADDQLLLECRHPEFRGDEDERPRDHACVVAEKEAAKRRYKGNKNRVSSKSYFFVHRPTLVI